MGERFDMVLKNGFLVDPVNQKSGRYDLGIKAGKVVAVAPDIDPARSDACFDVSGKTVLPGIIDLHVHVAGSIRGRYGHRMLARAGVTTALNMAGVIDSVLDHARQYGAGLNLASLHQVRPKQTVADIDPKRDELEDLLERVLEKGAIGLKILGGHFPLTAAATARTLEVAGDHQAYMAFHAGTLETESNLNGVYEAVDLSCGRPFHLAHVNSYTRGLIKPYMAETEAAISLLEENPHVCSESYLAVMNGTSGRCVNGVPESKATQTWLQQGGFRPTEQGLAQAILAGWALVNVDAGGDIVLSGGEDGLNWWKNRQTRAAVSFKVNPPEPRIRLATAKRKKNGFVVDCISTDGGGIPRNVIVEMGLSLVKLQALSMDEFVMKTSVNPAGLLGLQEKGHLGEGADADISVIDFDTQTPDMTIANGKIVMYRGDVRGTGATVITLPQGEAYVRQKGLTPKIVNPERTPFYKKKVKANYI